MPTITRKFEFDAGHRIMNHESKCRHLHGHRYVALVTVRSPELDSLGRVIDFGEVKEVIGEWIDAFWDHRMLLHPDDHWAERFDAYEQGEGLYLLRCFDTSTPLNPTAENMAKVLFQVVHDLMNPRGIDAVRVVLYETPNCYAEYPDEPAC
jgi:6-pyruvoyltetrahydropterin/6-carboxytetrahydropterin synthase